MSQATIRTAIYNAVNGVSNKGVCYDYERWRADWAGFLSLFKTTVSGTPQIRGWEVAYRGYEPTRHPQFSRITLQAHRFVVQGYMGVDDSEATEKTFATLAETVCETLDADSTLHSSTYWRVSSADLQAFEPRMFGSVLCHFAQIAITVTEEVS